MEPRRIRVDMHTHCEYSFDSRTPVAEQARAIRAAGLDAVCATDHDTIEGALRLREIADGFRVIVGEEISTRDGEIIGLFLERAIPADISAVPPRSGGDSPFERSTTFRLPHDRRGRASRGHGGRLTPRVREIARRS